VTPEEAQHRLDLARQYNAPNDPDTGAVRLDLATNTPRLAAERGAMNPFGVSDEIGGVINGVLDWAGINPAGGGDGTFSGGYNRFVDKARALDKAAADQHPLLYAGGQMLSGGAVLAPLASTEAGARALGITGDTLLSRVGAGTASGAALGAATGYASGEGDVANRLQSAGYGAATGGALGGAAPLVGAVAGKVVGAGSRVADWLKGAATGDEPYTQAAGMLGHGGPEPVTVAKSPHIMAAKALANAMAADEGAASAAASPGALLGEAGPNLTQLSGGITSLPGEGQSIIRKALTARAAGATDRITNALDATLGPERDVLQTADDISQVQSTRAKPLYDAVRNQPMYPTDNLNFVLGTKQGQAAIAKAQDLAETFGHTVDPTLPDVGSMDYVKRALDDQISKSIRAGATAKTAGLQNLRNILVNEVDQQYPAYAQARQAWAGPAAVKDALEAGQTAFSNDQSPTAMRRVLNGMTPSENQAYTVGARAQIAQVMGTARSDPAGAINVFSKSWNREKLNALVGPERAQSLVDAIQHERNLKAFGTEVAAGSQTAGRLAAQETLKRKSLVGRMIGQARIVFGIGKLAGLARLGGLRVMEGLLDSHDEARNEQVAAIIARGLVAHDAEKAQLVDALQRGLARMNAIDRRSSGAAALVRALTSTSAVPATATITRNINQAQ
jgi:hypothetical protein